MKSTIKEVEDLYDINYYESIKGRYFNSTHLQEFINSSNLKFYAIGNSLLNRPILKTTLGKGKIKVLLWSQMHGNETTGTKAILDALLILQSNSTLLEPILTNLQIDFIPILNPDAAQLYSRLHPSGIDMNRDFLNKSLPETNLLIKLITTEKYTTLFNLHDQRSIFGALNNEPATLSFLAPSENLERKITPNRKKAMGVINYVNNNLQMLIKGKIGRYTDEFYPTASGDNFSKMGFPCILFEAGHYPNDYKREKTRKYNAIAIILGLYFIANQDDLTIDYENYFKIPENNTKFLDIIFRNVTLDNASNPIDIGIQFTEKLNTKTNKVVFDAKFLEVGDLRNKIGHKEYNSNNRLFNSSNGKYPSIGEKANFSLGHDWSIKNGKLV